MEDNNFMGMMRSDDSNPPSDESSHLPLPDLERNITNDAFDDLDEPSIDDMPENPWIARPSQHLSMVIDEELLDVNSRIRHWLRSLPNPLKLSLSVRMFPRTPLARTLCCPRRALVHPSGRSTSSHQSPPCKIPADTHSNSHTHLECFDVRRVVHSFVLQKVDNLPTTLLVSHEYAMSFNNTHQQPMPAFV